MHRRIGVLGGGQLGRMLGLAGIPLAAEFSFLDPSATPPAACVGRHLRHGFDDVAGGAALAEISDVVTYEFEHLHLPLVESIAARCEVHPSPRALGIVQDRLTQKNFLARLDIAVAPFASIETAVDLQTAVARLGTPCLLKTARDGYDGKGQQKINDPAQALAAWTALGQARCVLEGFVHFQRELSLISTRGRDGATVFYPLVENQHRAGILHLTRAPAAHIDAAIQAQAENAARRLLHELAYVGTFTIEFFQVGTTLIVNELAPRVHNSGHWTIEGAVTSQFENHVRALMGVPLGDASPRGFAAMVNIVGTFPDRAQLLAIPGIHLHDYGKEPRPGRKLGHITITDMNGDVVDQRVQQVLALLPT